MLNNPVTFYAHLDLPQSIHLPVVLYTTTSPHPVSPRRRALAYALDAAFLCATAMAFVASARTMWLQLLHPSEESQH